MAAARVADLLASAARRAPHQLALIDRGSNTRLSSLQLASAVRSTGRALTALGYGPGTRVATCLGSQWENVVVQLAAAVGGHRVATVKVGADLAACVDPSGPLACHGIIADAGAADDATAASRTHPPLLCGGGSGGLNFSDFVDPTDELPESVEELAALDVGTDNDADFAMYNTTSRGAALSALLAQGDAASTALGMHEQDTVLLPVTLNHSMGMGFGVAAVLHAGATLVLPGDEGVDSTLAAIGDEGVTILYADSHTLKRLEASGATGADYPALRGGLIKIGSGEDIGADSRRTWGSLSLTTVGKPAGDGHGHGHGHGHNHGHGHSHGH